MLSQWGRVEDEATESMAPRKPATLAMQSGLLSQRQPDMRTPLLLVIGLCTAQLLVLAVLGGGLTIARSMLQRVDVALDGLDNAQLQVLPAPPVDWAATLASHQLVSQEEEEDKVVTDALSFDTGLYSRTLSVRSGGALLNSTVEEGTWSVNSGVLGLTPMSGNGSDAAAGLRQRTLGRQGAFVRVGNAATCMSKLFAFMAGGG